MLKHGTGTFIPSEGFPEGLKMVPDSVTMMWKEKEIIPTWQIEDWQNELRCIKTRSNWLERRIDEAKLE